MLATRASWGGGRFPPPLSFQPLWKAALPKDFLHLPSGLLKSCQRMGTGAEFCQDDNPLGVNAGGTVFHWDSSQS